MSFKYIFWIYALALLLLTTLPTFGPGEQLQDITVLRLRLDYLIHISIFFPWAYFFMHTHGRDRLVPAFLTGLFGAVFLEGLQLLLPYRSFNINDMLANGIGVFLGTILPGLFWDRHTPGNE